jgi:hypothetical protein
VPFFIKFLIIHTISHKKAVISRYSALLSDTKLNNQVLLSKKKLYLPVIAFPYGLADFKSFSALAYLAALTIFMDLVIF